MTLLKFSRPEQAPGAFRFSHSFDDLFDQFGKADELNWIPSVNITERAEDYKIDLAVPGMEKKDFKIEVENNVLILRGEPRVPGEEKREEGEKVSRREFHYGNFQRSFSLPQIADSENISANYKDGVLSVVIGKKEEAKVKPKKEISVS